MNYIPAPVDSSRYNHPKPSTPDKPSISKPTRLKWINRFLKLFNGLAISFRARVTSVESQVHYGNRSYLFVVRNTKWIQFSAVSWALRCWGEGVPTWRPGVADATARKMGDVFFPRVVSRGRHSPGVSYPSNSASTLGRSPSLPPLERVALSTAIIVWFSHLVFDLALWLWCFVVCF